MISNICILKPEMFELHLIFVLLTIPKLSPPIARKVSLFYSPLPCFFFFLSFFKSWFKEQAFIRNNIVLGYLCFNFWCPVFEIPAILHRMQQSYMQFLITILFHNVNRIEIYVAVSRCRTKLSTSSFCFIYARA